jgi:Family of unknown function (DUF5338)
MTEKNKIIDFYLKNKKDFQSRDQNAAAFTVHQAMIREAIQYGMSIKAIWESMVKQEMISLSYPGFRKQLQRHFKSELDKRAGKEVKESEQKRTGPKKYSTSVVPDDLKYTKKSADELI